MDSPRLYGIFCVGLYLSIHIMFILGISENTVSVRSVTEFP